MINSVIKIINLFKVKKETCFICKVNSAEYILTNDSTGSICEQCRAKFLLIVNRQRPDPSNTRLNTQHTGEVNRGEEKLRE